MTSPDTPHYELTAEEVASPEFRKKLCRSGLRMGALIDLCDMALKGFALSEKEPMLERCCKLFGWQGGTVHQATAEIERLLKSKNDGLVWAEKLKALDESGVREELPHLAALRELREETGFEAEALYSVDAIFDLYKWQRGSVDTTVPFAAQVASGADPVLSEEHDDWRWASLSAALELLPYEPQREAIRRISADLLDRPGSAQLYRIESPSERPEKTR